MNYPVDLARWQRLVHIEGLRVADKAHMFFVNEVIG